MYIIGQLYTDKQQKGAARSLRLTPFPYTPFNVTLRKEVHLLGHVDPHVHFALLGDFRRDELRGLHAIVQAVDRNIAGDDQTVARTRNVELVRDLIRCAVDG